MFDDEPNPDTLDISVRRIDQAWHVVATGRDAEHTHGQRFFVRDDAWQLAHEIRRGLQGGRDLNLRFWDSISR